MMLQTVVRLVLTASILLAHAAAVAQETPEPDGQALFFEGLDLRDAGDWEGAIARFQLAISQDPSLHQARLHLAECFFELGMYDEAIREAQRYLDADFEMAETRRARDLIGLCRFEASQAPVETVAETTTSQPAEPLPEELALVEEEPVPVEEEPVPVEEEPVLAEEEPVPVEEEPTRIEVALPVPRARDTGWAAVTVETGAAVGHFANSAGLTTVGPLLAGRFLPLRYLELTVQGRLGFGPYTEQGGTVRVPDLGVGAAASIPIRKVRIVAGAVIPLVFSGYGGETHADAGVLGIVGVRVCETGSRLVIGGQVEAGYLVSPYVGGSFRIGFQIGPLR